MSTVPSGTRFIGIAENVNLTERKSAVLNTETQPYTIQDIADTVGVGAQGPQGVQGPAGPLGPVGPAGLNWQGAWVSETSYVADDAVGYGGASYFCILATSGTTTPNLATTNWALLASQGAQGIQGVQGPTGAQGASGGAGTLQQTVDNGNEVNDGFGNITKIYSGAIETIDIAGRITIGSDVDLQKGIYTAKIYNPGNHTANRTYTLPDASGTVALKTCNETVILLSYDGTSFTYTNVINELGVTITFLVTSGTLYCTLSSSVLTLNKTIIWASSFTEFGGYLTQASRDSGNSFRLDLTNTNGTNDTFPTSFYDLPIRIQVYN
jgi:hypothetical protein